MIHRIEIIPERRLMLQYFAGEVCIESLVEALQTILREPDYDPCYDGLTLMIDAEVGLSAAGVKQFSDFFKNTVQCPDLGKLALLVDRPSHTALSQIFQYELEQVQEVKVFSTLKGACRFMNLNFEEILGFVEQLKAKEPVNY